MAICCPAWQTTPGSGLAWRLRCERTPPLGRDGVAWRADLGIETPTRAELARFDRARKDKKTSNKDWRSPQDPHAKVAKMKDGGTHLAYKVEHGVDPETGAISG